MKIVLTGATGFLGSHIAEALVSEGHQLLLTKRNSSDLWRCASIIDNVSWVNTDDSDWKEKVKLFCPQILIHSAWEGVYAGKRDEWATQVKNLVFQQELLDLAKEVKLEKFIGVGSQAEYGAFNGSIDEAFPTHPASAYGAAKLASSIILSTFCEQHQINWYWFRLFSCFGERESDNWLIPATIKNMLSTSSMDLTPGEQQYSYLYIKDVARVFASSVTSDAPNGIYHIASPKRRSLREILEFIQENLNPEFVLNWGALPYRAGQSMVNGSHLDKTIQAFGPIDDSMFYDNLLSTINYYKEKYK